VTGVTTRYFFDVREGDFVASDEEGTVLRDVTQALQTARVAVAEIAGEVLPAGRTDKISIEIRYGEKQIARITVSMKTELLGRGS
jgi:hypothetical protein